MYGQGTMGQAAMSLTRSLPQETSTGRRWAIDLFNKELRRARWAQLWRRLTNRVTFLPTMAALSAEQKTKQRHGGVRTVQLSDIVGSEGRGDDFDTAFRPLQSHTRDRWVNIAMLMWENKPLPAIDLLQIGDVYYIRDGHHRVSVARALGMCALDAHITHIGD